MATLFGPLPSEETEGRGVQWRKLITFIRACYALLLSLLAAAVPLALMAVAIITRPVPLLLSFKDFSLHTDGQSGGLQANCTARYIYIECR